MINPGNSLKKRGCDPHIKPGFKKKNSGLQCYSKSILEGANVNLLDVALKASSFAPKGFMKLRSSTSSTSSSLVRLFTVTSQNGAELFLPSTWQQCNRGGRLEGTHQICGARFQS